MKLITNNNKTTNMQRSISNKIQRTVKISGVAGLIAGAIVLALSGVRAQTPAPAKWPTEVPHKAAMDAFSAALTEAGWNKETRDALKASPDSAKQKVTQLGNIDIPADIFIMFYEPQTDKQSTTEATLSSSILKNGKYGVFRTTDGKTFKSEFDDNTSSEKYHIFALPPFNENDKTKKYYYNDGYLKCCYREWWQ
jgi:hypothetical protein